MYDVLKPPGSLLATVRSKAVVLVLFLLNVFGVGVACRFLYSFVVYLNVRGSGSIFSVGKRELICLLLFTCNYVVSVRREFLFLWVLGVGHVILLWHSLSLPYNYFGVRVSVTFHFMCVHIILALCRLLSGHLLGNCCSLG